MCRYGSEAAEAAALSIPVAKDMVNATLNTTRLGARAVVSKTAKRTAKMYLKHTFAGVHPQDQAAFKRSASAGVGGSAAAAAAAASAGAGSSGLGAGAGAGAMQPALHRLVSAPAQPGYYGAPAPQ